MEVTVSGLLDVWEISMMLLDGFGIKASATSKLASPVSKETLTDMP